MHHREEKLLDNVHKYCELSNCRGGWYKRGGLAIYKNQLMWWAILCFL